jgi:photosystem II stability/assembly factor-like uncharacterized protein
VLGFGLGTTFFAGAGTTTKKIRGVYMSSYYKSILVCIIYLLNINISFPQNVTWNKLSSPQGIRIEQIAFNSKGDIFICTWWHPDSMVLDANIDRIERSKDHGNTWETVFNAGWQPLTMAIDSFDNLYTGRFENAYKSSNNGDIWETLADTLLAGIFVNSISISPKGYIFIAPGTFRSTDNGKHWNIIPLQYQVTNLLFLNNGAMLAGVITGYYPIPGRGIYRSTNDGKSWDSVFTSDNSVGWSLVESKNGTVFAATSGYDSTHGGIYRSTDSGISWSSVNNGLPSRKVNAVAASSTGELFAAINGTGIFQSVDNGNSWTNFTNGLDDLRIQCLEINLNDQLFVGTGPSDLPTPETLRGSVYYCNTITFVPHNNSTFLAKFELSQNYPNPFNPNTIIKYSIPITSKVRLTVYNLLGEEVAVLVNDIQKQGIYEVTFNANTLPSGVYFYRIDAGNKYSDVKKMLLIK